MALCAAGGFGRMWKGGMNNKMRGGGGFHSTAMRGVMAMAMAKGL